MNSNIHFGNIIMQTLQEKGLTVAWLARQVSCDESNFSKKLKNNTIERELLYWISYILHVDFFEHYREELRKQWNDEEQGGRAEAGN